MRSPPQHRNTLAQCGGNVLMCPLSAFGSVRCANLHHLSSINFIFAAASMAWCQACEAFRLDDAVVCIVANGWGNRYAIHNHNHFHLLTTITNTLPTTSSTTSFFWSTSIHQTLGLCAFDRCNIISIIHSRQSAQINTTQHKPEDADMFAVCK